MEDLDFFVLYNIFDRSKNRQTSATNPKMKQKRCQGRRACTAGGTTRDPGKVHRALRGVPPPGTSQGKFLGSGLLGTYLFRCQFSNRILMTCWRRFDNPKLQKSIPKRSKITSKIDSKTERKLTWKIMRNHENMIRMQSAKTSKFMLPFWRRVHLHKSASFKTSFEEIKTNQ